MIRRVAIVHKDPNSERLAQRLSDNYPLSGGPPVGARYVAQTGRAQLYPEIPEEIYDSSLVDAGRAEIVRTIGTNSAMIVPIESSGQRFGVVSFVRGEDAPRYCPQDLDLAIRIGRRAAQAVERATLYTEARAAEERYRALVEHMPAIAYTRRIGPDLRLTYVSPQIEQLLGIQVEDCLATGGLEARMEPAAWRALQDAHAGLKRSGEGFQLEYQLSDQHNGIRWVRDEGILMTDQQDDRRIVHGVLLDITERKELEAELRHQAVHDTLTGLPNRAYFFDQVERARRASQGFAILFLDLDNFKVINDSLGHLKGDGLLVAVAARLRGIVRRDDTIARLGGDEFAILAANVCDQAAAERLAEKILVAMQQPFTVDRREIYVSPSIGVVMARNEEADAETLLRDADTAMYRAKRRGRARYEIFSPEQQKRVARRLTFEHELRRGIAKDEFVLHYQPLYEICSRSLVGVEALLRWQHPESGLTAPQEIIPIAEETGLIVPLGHWVVEEACQQLRTWQERRPEMNALRMNVNVSALQLGGRAFVDEIRQALDQAEIPANRLVLEITETAMIQSYREASATLEALRELGVRIAIDDFGTGYSTLNLLKTLPVDELKIDREFVDGLPNDPTNTIIVSGVIGLARANGLQTIAEGVETPAQLQHLQDLGCDYAQGFHLCRPVPAWQLPTKVRQAGNSDCQPLRLRRKSG